MGMQALVVSHGPRRGDSLGETASIRQQTHKNFTVRLGSLIRKSAGLGGWWTWGGCWRSDAGAPLLCYFRMARTNQLPLFAGRCLELHPCNISTITLFLLRCTPLWLGALLYDGVSLSHVSMNLFTG